MTTGHPAWNDSRPRLTHQVPADKSRHPVWEQLQIDAEIRCGLIAQVRLNIEERAARAEFRRWMTSRQRETLAVVAATVASWRQ